MNKIVESENIEGYSVSTPDINLRTSYNALRRFKDIEEIRSAEKIRGLQIARNAFTAYKAAGDEDYANNWNHLPLVTAVQLSFFLFS